VGQWWGRGSAAGLEHETARGGVIHVVRESITIVCFASFRLVRYRDLVQWLLGCSDRYRERNFMQTLKLKLKHTTTHRLLRMLNMTSYTVHLIQ